MSTPEKLIPRVQRHRSDEDVRLLAREELHSPAMKAYLRGIVEEALREFGPPTPRSFWARLLGR